MNNPDDIKSKLNRAIAETVSDRGSYADDFRHFTRNRKLPLDELVKLMLTMTGGTLARELYDAGVEMAPSSFVEARKRISFLAFKKILGRFNELCDDPATLKGFKVLSIDGSTIPCPRNPKSNNFYTSETNPKGWNNTKANLVYDVLNYIFVDCNMGEGELDSRKAHDEQGAL